MPDFEPFIRYGEFGESSVNFTVILRAREFVDQYLIRHEFIKRLHVRYGREGVTIPFPQRTVHLSPASPAEPSHVSRPGGSRRRVGERAGAEPA